MSDKGRKSLRAAKKAARRIRVQRDKEVTKRGGNEAHRMCGRKKRYPNKVAAEMIAMKSEALYNAPPLRTYQCPWCGGWHLTKLPKDNGNKEDD